MSGRGVGGNGPIREFAFVVDFHEIYVQRCRSLFTVERLTPRAHEDGEINRETSIFGDMDSK